LHLSATDPVCNTDESIETELIHARALMEHLLGTGPLDRQRRRS
jgi:hypothetical protein